VKLQDLTLHESWQAHLNAEFEKTYMQALSNFLTEELASGQTIYPQKDDIFAALNTTPFDKVKVIILGQDPYHGENQAHGLSFSVPLGEKIPPSLVNIFKEIDDDLKLAGAMHGNLTYWAEQGVLLLNSVLTVRHSDAASHQGKGWETFTDQIIEQLNQNNENLVFMLWGSYAQKKGAMIDRDRHCVLSAPHPSPLSAYRGFLGCQHFSICNDYLDSKNIKPIDWTV